MYNLSITTLNTTLEECLVYLSIVVSFWCFFAILLFSVLKKREKAYYGFLPMAILVVIWAILYINRIQ